MAPKATVGMAKEATGKATREPCTRKTNKAGVVEVEPQGGRPGFFRATVPLSTAGRTPGHNAKAGTATEITSEQPTLDEAAADKDAMSIMTLGSQAKGVNTQGHNLASLLLRLDRFRKGNPDAPPKLWKDAHGKIKEWLKHVQGDVALHQQVADLPQPGGGVDQPQQGGGGNGAGQQQEEEEEGGEADAMEIVGVDAGPASPPARHPQHPPAEVKTKKSLFNKLGFKRGRSGSPPETHPQPLKKGFFETVKDNVKDGVAAIKSKVKGFKDKLKAKANGSQGGASPATSGTSNDTAGSTDTGSTANTASMADTSDTAGSYGTGATPIPTLPGAPSASDFTSPPTPFFAPDTKVVTRHPVPKDGTVVFPETPTPPPPVQQPENGGDQGGEDGEAVRADPDVTPKSLWRQSGPPDRYGGPSNGGLSRASVKGGALSRASSKGGALGEALL